MSITQNSCHFSISDVVLTLAQGAKQTSVNISTVVVRPLTLEALCKASGARGMAIAVHRQVVHLKYLADHVESIQHEYHGNK
jgi:hypothetical protein